MAAMPVEPPPSPWLIPSPRRTDAQGLVGVGADLEPGTMLAGYRSGVFPMPVDRVLGWFSPDPRAVIPLVAHGPQGGADGPLPLSRSLRRARRRFEIRVDTAFQEVVAGCADPRRPGGWITREMTSAYSRLYELGWAHSVEAWTVEPAGAGGGPGDASGGRLAGGLFGVAVGGLFAAESMFHLVTDGSKAAVVGLLELLRAEEDADARLLDVQWLSPHLRTLGAVEVSRDRYLRAVRTAVDLPTPVAFRNPGDPPAGGPVRTG